MMTLMIVLSAGHVSLRAATVQKPDTDDVYASIRAYSRAGLGMSLFRRWIGHWRHATDEPFVE